MYKFVYLCCIFILSPILLFGTNYNKVEQEGKDSVISDYDLKKLLPISKNINALMGSIYADPSANPSERALDLIRRLSFDEKLAMCGGFNGFMLSPIERLGIRPISMADASQGIRLATSRIKKYSTSFPCMLALASTWNRALAHDFGYSIGEESRALGVDILLGPGINMQRLSTSGRNYEYMGEDPFLTGIIATQYIIGLQEKGVIATPKHFLGNDQEFCRHIASSNIDERTMREIYLLPWEMVIKEGNAKAIMTGNNLVNGVPAVMNKSIIMDILRKDYGFTGIAMSDWQNTSYYPKLQNLVLPSGESLLMPDNKSFRLWVESEIKISKERKNEIELMLEKMIYHNLYTVFSMGIYDREFYDPSMFKTFDKHKRIARQTAEESVVLLKNDDSILPLKKSQKILFIGKDEIQSGFGSGFVQGYDHTSFIDGLAGHYGKNFTYSEKPDDKTIKEAEIVLYSLNKLAGEGSDVPFKEPVNELNELRRIIKLNKNVIVLINSCNPIPMNDWITDVKGVLWCYFLGQERGNALADIISGKKNPSGKLPFTIERSFSESPDPDYNYIGGKPFWLGNNEYKNYWLKRSDVSLNGFSDYVKPGEVIDVDYNERLYIGYRWYDKMKIPVLFPFGYGLSYTTFEYSDLMLDNRLETEGKIYVNVKIKNTGEYSGSEVVQVYVNDKESSFDRPLKELKGFEKVSISPGETKRVVIELNERSFSYWDIKSHDWKIEAGDFLIMVGGGMPGKYLTENINIEK